MSPNPLSTRMYIEGGLLSPEPNLVYSGRNYLKRKIFLLLYADNILNHFPFFCKVQPDRLNEGEVRKQRGEQDVRPQPSQYKDVHRGWSAFS